MWIFPDPAQSGGPTFPFCRWRNWDLRHTAASEKETGIPGQDWYPQHEKEVAGLTLLILMTIYTVSDFSSPFLYLWWTEKRRGIDSNLKGWQKRRAGPTCRGAGLAANLPRGPEPALTLWARFACLFMVAVPQVGVWKSSQLWHPLTGAAPCVSVHSMYKLEARMGVVVLCCSHQNNDPEYAGKTI